MLAVVTVLPEFGIFDIFAAFPEFTGRPALTAPLRIPALACGKYLSSK
jgi:hypothetical protein